MTVFYGKNDRVLNMNQRRMISYLILLENLFKPRQLYLQP